MRKDHRPYFVKRLCTHFCDWYGEHFLRPQFKYLGRNPTFIRPWYVRVFGWSVELGDFATVVGAPDANVHLINWSKEDLQDLSLIVGSSDLGVEKSDGPKGEQTHIRIGKYALICPGVRIHSATEIVIGDGCMMAQGAYITDSDWHGIYDRCQPVGNSAPVRIGDNVWIGDHAIICKGVTIGDNSIVGAGSVVTRSIPPNTVAVGNPAAIVRELDTELSVNGRETIFARYHETQRTLEEADREAHKGNTLMGWIRYLVAPKWGD
ncbi:acyltransferase [Thermodesulfobacteriota bacterium]